MNNNLPIFPAEARPSAPNPPPAKSKPLPSVQALLLWLVLGCLLPGSIGAIVLFVHMLNEGRSQLQQLTLQTARTLVMEVDSKLAQIEVLALALAHSSSLAANNFEDFHHKAREILESTSIASNVVLSDASGQQIVNTLRDFGAPLPRYGNQAQLRQVFATGQTVVSDVFIGAIVVQPTVAVAVPVFVKGKVAYVLSVGIPPQWLNGLLHQHQQSHPQQLPQDWGISIFDSTGTIAARNHLPEQFVGKKATSDLLAHYAENEGELEVNTVEGIPVLVFFSTSARYRWKVGIGIPRQQLEAALMRKVTLLGSGILLLVGLGIALAIFLGRRISLSVTALTLPTRDLAEGKTLSAPKVYFFEAQEVVDAMAQTAIQLVQRTRQTQLAEVDLRASEQALKQLNQALESKVQERTQALADLYDQAPCGYHSLDAEGRLVQVNQTELDLLGYTRDEYQGHRMTEFLDPENMTRFAQVYPQLQRDGKIREVEFDVTCKDGSRIPFLVSANIIRDAQGQFVATRSTMVDNRVSQARQQQITQLNQFLHDVLESLPFGMVVLNAARQVVLRNQLFGTLLDYPPVLLQQEPLDFTALTRFNFDRGDYPGQTYEEALNGFLHLIATRQSIRFERWQANGVYLEVRGQQISTDWILLTYTDITAFKKTEQALAQAREAADTANLAKSDFLSNISHELRTPLNAVVGLTRLLADSPLSQRQRNYAENIQLSAQALQALINNVLDFSKIEANELHLEQVPFSLNTLMRTLAAALGVGVGNKPIEALIEIAPDVPDALVGDALRLQQILLNLISNAVKFTHVGEIVISVRCLCGQDALAGAHATLEISVRDTGIGMTAASLATIFDSFTQASTSTSRLYGGTGLGLAISAQLAKLMGGRIGVDSTLGQGSEFRLEVPLTLGPKAAPSASEEIPANLRILIVDDHPLAREVLTRSCTALGWQAHAVASGEAGLQALLGNATEKRDYDLLLLDWHMPGMDGLEMLRQADAMPGIKRPWVVLMAPLVNLEQAVAASAGVNLDVTAKPLTPHSLVEVVTRAFSSKEEQSQPLVHGGVQRLAGMRLLVAEDNLINQEVVGQMLSRAGAEVVLVGDGLAVLTALKQPGEHFDAVLMDIQMPLMDGYTATRHIREELGLLDLPIIAVTAFARPEDRERSRLAGMVGHLVKPLDVDKLLDIVAHSRTPRRMENIRPSTPVKAGVIKLEGLDFVAALKLFGGDQAKFGDILRKFIAQQGDDVAQARRLFSAGDAEGAIRLVHDLRGVASFLHANDLIHLAGEAESAMLDGHADVMPGLFDELQAAMQTLKASHQQFAARYGEA